MIRSAHARMLEQLVRERRAALLESLLNILDAGVAGTIRGLDEALKLSDEADHTLNGDMSADR